MSARMEAQLSQASISSVSTSGGTYSLSAPPLPLYPSAESIAPHLDLPAQDLEPLLRHALTFAARQAEPELVRWLLALPVHAREVLPLDAIDEDGCGLVSLSILGSAGREDREDTVRLLAGVIGIAQVDRAGWTPLHHAALVSTSPLLSFLLTLGADPHAVTGKGLTPLDVVTELPSHTAQMALLASAMTSPPIRPATPSAAFGSPGAISQATFPSGSGIPSSTAALPRAAGLRRQPTTNALPAAVARAQLHRRAENKRRLRAEKERWMADVAAMAGVEPRHLLDRCWDDDDDEVDAEEEKLKRQKRTGRPTAATLIVEPTGYSSSSDESDSDEDEPDPRGHDELPPYHSCLVFSLPALPSLLDSLIATYEPRAHPRAWRAAPAHAIYLFAKFALHRCDDEWLEELVVGVVDRVEKSVYDNVDDLAHLAFWVYNSTLLLHLLRHDQALDLACHELNLFVMLEELCNAIHVFVIRFIERRVDTYLDAALLDYEPMSQEFEGLTFEGEWSFLKNLTGRGTTTAKRIVPRAKDLFAAATSSPARADSDGGGGWPSIGEAGRQQVQTSRPTSFADGDSRPDGASSSRPMSLSDFNALGRSSPSTTSTPTRGDAAPQASVTPRTLTTFLTSALVVLQLYEVNPAVITQAISQCFYWIGCETFNRILTRKRYLCRSKAVQIRMNLTALADWVRDSDLPGKISTRHLEPAIQLLGWIQTCSALDDFDGLIVTLSSLRSLNPLQMRRAVRDYRYEVGEGRMSDECAQYLAQLQKDWERRRVRLGVETLQRERLSAEHEQQQRQALRLDVYGSAAGPSAPSQDSTLATRGQTGDSAPDPATAVDLLFDQDVPLGQYEPPVAPESLGELLDSRYMLPFCLPSEVDLLAATPAPGAAFALLLPPATTNGGAGSNGSTTPMAGAETGGLLPSLLSLGSPRPSSRSSFASLRPLRFVARRHRPLRELPLDFLSWLDGQAAERQAAAARATAHAHGSSNAGTAAAAYGKQSESSLPARLNSLVADQRSVPSPNSVDNGTLRREAQPEVPAGYSPNDADADAEAEAEGASTIVSRPPTSVNGDAVTDDFGMIRPRAMRSSTTSSSSSFSSGPAPGQGHDRDISDASTIVGRSSSAQLPADDGGSSSRHRPPPLVLDRQPSTSQAGGSAPGSPASPSSASPKGGWFKSLPRRKTTLRTLISGGSGPAPGTP